MVASTLTGIRLAGVVACLPARREGAEVLAARFGADAVQRIAKATGIAARRVVAPGQCASDLAEAAARSLLDRLGWTADQVDLLVLVSQTPDHPLPATACLLHRRLGLAKRCAAFDLGLGCSGYIYGLWTAAALLSTLAEGARALLLVGDTTSRLIAPDDRAVAPLFGDAAAASALVRDAAAAPMAFDLGSDGAGAPYLTVPGGAFRHPHRCGAAPAVPETLFMDGTQVFAFTLREVPGTIAAALAGAGWTPAEVDHFVLHQANAQMIRHLTPKIGATPEQVVLALAEYGNTSSASIPLALTEALAGPLTTRPLRLVLSGFGVGWSWGSVALATTPLAACGTVVLDDAPQLVMPPSTVMT